MNTKAIVITTINPPSDAVRDIARMVPDWDFFVIGDTKTPADWAYPGTRYFDVPAQQALPFRYAQLCPTRHYARKNIGYLEAMRTGATVLAETDDDNLPYAGWLSTISRTIEARQVEKQGWENVYTHFSRERIWPRGFPLELVNESLRQVSPLSALASHDCAVQQFLADDNPDVDAVFRLTTDREIKFTPNRIVLDSGTFSAFNSQNTVWWKESFPLLYLPANVSFRMTDIWRSYVAQVCLHAMGAKLAFCEATMFQVRNEHSLIRDFRDEVPGYLHNMRIMELLAGLTLVPEPSKCSENLRACYAALIAEELVPAAEMPLLDAWVADVAACGS